VTDFGRDTSVTDRRRSGRLVSGPLLVGQALYRRFITRRGTLRGPSAKAKEYGFRLSDLLGQAVDAPLLASIPGRIQAEAAKERRLIRADVVVFRRDVGVSVELDITITGYTAEGPFELVLRVDKVTVELLSLTAGGTT
jgi:hypothetical protein